MFIKIPKDEITVKNETNIARCLLDMCRYLGSTQQSALSIESACITCNIVPKCGEDRFPSKLKSALSDMVVLEQITPLIHTDIEKVQFSTHLLFKLADDFFPKTNFVKLDYDDFKKIMTIKNVSKPIVLGVYLYVKSFIDPNGQSDIGRVAAFYQPVMTMSKALDISRKYCDTSLAKLVNAGLLVKHQAGSYISHGSKINAPNIYVLPEDDTKDNIRSVINRINYIYQTDN